MDGMVRFTRTSAQRGSPPDFPARAAELTQIGGVQRGDVDVGAARLEQGMPPFRL